MSLSEELRRIDPSRVGQCMDSVFGESAAPDTNGDMSETIKARYPVLNALPAMLQFLLEKTSDADPDMVMNMTLGARLLSLTLVRYAEGEDLEHQVVPGGSPAPSDIW